MVRHQSLSARRAWIEIFDVVAEQYHYQVALRKESVDRNKDGDKPFQTLSGSLSARRAWIEISIEVFAVTGRDQSLSARRAWIEILFAII